MIKNEDKIQLAGTTVYYGKTLLKDFLNYGYTVEEERMYFHEKSSTVVCGFLKDMKYLGELVFFDIEEFPTIDELKNLPINLILLEDESLEISSPEKLTIKKKSFLEKSGNKTIESKSESFIKFMEFNGKAGSKDVKFLTIGYLLCWLIIMLGYKNMPKEIIYITALLPIVFFGLAFIFWKIKRFFSWIYKKTSKSIFISICIILFLGSSYFTSRFIGRKGLDKLNYKGISFGLILVILYLSIIIFLSYQIILFWLFDNKVSNNKDLLKRYLPIHILIYVIAGGLYYFFQLKSNFLVLVLIQFGIYTMFSFIIWLRILITIILWRNL